jgi:hypothetical protein
VGVNPAAVDVWVGQTLHIGKRPSIALAMRLSPFLTAALGFAPGDQERPEDAPDDWKAVPSLPPDDQLFAAIGLVVIARALPSLFPGADKIREASATDLIRVHDLVLEVLVEQGVPFAEIGKLSNFGQDLLQATFAKLNELGDARKAARGNSGAPTGPSSTGPG